MDDDGRHICAKDELPHDATACYGFEPVEEWNPPHWFRRLRRAAYVLIVAACGLVVGRLLLATF